MRALILTIFLIIYNVCNGEKAAKIAESNVIGLTQSYRNATYNFFVPLYKTVAYKSNLNFVISLRSIWLMLAAIAEGGNEETQQQLFKLLHLPDDPYHRQKFYEVMTSRVPSNVLSLYESRTLFIDDNLNINLAWLNLVARNALLDVIPIPIQNNPILATNWIKRLVTAIEPRIDLSGNSLMLDTIDYNVLWASAFDDAIVENSPFYNQEGEVIGSVELMRMKRRAKIGYVKSLKAKVLELPVGSDGKYRMLFVISYDKKHVKSLTKNINNDIIYEMFDSLKDTVTPIDIAIPRIKITSVVDMREILQVMNVTNVWQHPESTKYISTPPAFPTSYLQRATLTLNKYGLAPPPPLEIPPSAIRSGLHPELDIDFIADQPVMCGLFDTETHTPLIAMGFSQPPIYKFGTTYVNNI